MDSINQEIMKGSIHLIIGPMFGGKTTMLINRVERFHYAKKKCLLIKHSIDNRYNHLVKQNGIVCNNGVEYSTIKIITSGDLTSLSKEIKNYDVIGVMESQFFDDLLIVDEWANSGKIIICDGLSGDSNRDNFGKIPLLIPKCEKITKLNAVCINCGDDASFTKKKIQTENLSYIDVGGIDKYIPVCRSCYFK